jgi:hypothetical protein
MRTYTFHVTLPDHKGVSRKVELPAEATLEWLHYAIQDAYNFNADHLYSFFMSGKAWDESSEYSLPEDVDPLGDGPLGEEDDEDEEFLNEYGDLLTESAREPLTPDQMRNVLQMLKSDPEARQLVMKVMSEQMGLPPAMVQMVMGNIENSVSSMSDEQLNQMIQMGSPFAAVVDDDDDEEYEDEEAAGNVRTTTLTSLKLRKGQNFLYLFDYGDEWRFTVKLHAINENGDPEAEYPRIVESVGTAPQQYPDWEEEDEE